jgi:AcrR family transcriptional regulator
MLVAAEKLMVRHGNDDFTLSDVAKAGKVSIGSIYLRFNSKDDLIRAVHMNVLSRVDVEQREMLQAVRERSNSLESFVTNLVEDYAESLRRYAAILRPIMLRASYDPKISGLGKASADRIGTQIQREMLSYRDEIVAERPERAVNSAYRVIYATIARYLGFGSSQEVSDEGDWTELKEDLGQMCAAFLVRRID